jgi:hypothetical protein
MSGEDIGNVDAVQSEAEAIQRAEKLLATAPELYKQTWIKWSKRTGKQIPSELLDFELTYTLYYVNEYPQGWYMTYWREHKEATIDPPFEYITVNRKTGETKLGDFREE